MSVRLITAALLFCASAALAQTPEVAKIFRSRCYGCHGAAQQMSGFRLDQRDAALKGGYSGTVIVPGKSSESKLIQRVSAKPGVQVMPPAGPRLTPAEVEAVSKWIDAGAAWDT